MKNRIKKIRRELDLTQQQFAEKLKVPRNTIAGYEVGKSNPSDGAINNICKTFNVNESWLRTGEGEMFAPAPSDELDALAKKYNMDSTERKFFAEYLQLNEAERSAVFDFLKKVCGGKQPETPSSLSDLSIDERVALYRQELEREEKAEERFGA